MRNFIITAIVALAAAKVKAETEDKYNNLKGIKKQERREEFIARIDITNQSERLHPKF
jgi:hypothetical protein